MNNYSTKVIRDGSIFYYNNMCQYHRLDGPAIEYASGYKYWYINGRLHREDGPAVEHLKEARKFWYLNGVAYLEKDFLYQIKFKEKYQFDL